MPLLVDGHNLIGQISTISLADPDDEAQLVMLLRGYATRKRGRQVIVVFDHGVYGHPQRLDGYGVRCYFAKSPQDADAQLIKRLTGLSRPGDWTLVTSDRDIAEAARERGVRVISSQAFAAQLLGEPTPTQAPMEEKHDVRLSEAEVEEWLRLFNAAASDDAQPPGASADRSVNERSDTTGRSKKRKRRGR